MNIRLICEALLAICLIWAFYKIIFMLIMPLFVKEYVTTDKLTKKYDKEIKQTQEESND